VETERGLRGWAAAGKINGNVHEVDPSSLTIENGQVTGELIVIYRDDQHFDLNSQQNTAIAGIHRIDARVGSGVITGKHTGTIGASRKTRKTCELSSRPECPPVVAL
jgi:hypothetical protein